MEAWNVKDDTKGVKCGTMIEVEGTKPNGRPRKTWSNDIKEDMNRFGLNLEDAQAQKNGEEILRGDMANPVHLEDGC